MMLLQIIRLFSLKHSSGVRGKFVSRMCGGWNGREWGIIQVSLTTVKQRLQQSLHPLTIMYKGNLNYLNVNR